MVPVYCWLDRTDKIVSQCSLWSSSPGHMPHPNMAQWSLLSACHLYFQKHPEQHTPLEENVFSEYTLFDCTSYLVPPASASVGVLSSIFTDSCQQHLESSWVGAHSLQSAYTKNIINMICLSEERIRSSPSVLGNPAHKRPLHCFFYFKVLFFTFSAKWMQKCGTCSHVS